jgi:anaerobic magnesium-protoporphyrin IX monomethyl ester cyclase
MKVTFLVPPAIDGKAPERLFGCNMGVYFQPNIFMLYPAAMLENHKHTAVVMDCPVEKIDWTAFEQFLRTDDSDVYVFYTVFLSKEVDIRTQKMVRGIRTAVPIVFTGPEPTTAPADFLLDEQTFVIRGEPEYAMLELVNELAGKKRFGQITGLSLLSQGKPKDNPMRPLPKSYDDIPFPARHLIKKELYYNPKLEGRPSTVILTSRTCWGRCKYCIPSSYTFAREIEYKKHMGRKPIVGIRSAENIIDEFKQIKNEGYKAVAVIDDNFVNGKERTIKICEGIKGLGLEWGCLTRADTIKDPEIVKAMAEAGCRYVDLGVESFDQKVLDYVHKDMKVEDNINAINLLRQYGITPKVNILFGASPYETEATIRKTVKTAKKLDLDYISFGVVIPHPQTEYYKEIKSGGMFATRSKDFEAVDPIKQATIELPNISQKKLQQMVRWAYRSYYLRPSYAWKMLKKIKSFKQFRENLRTLWNLIR